ncbi:MAG: hypothetical protein IPJ86_14900 [Bacteroidetes bacterium]|nr:hypothetical protein [Bacteroidota bacterium]
MNPPTENDKLTYRRIRSAIGILGMGLPVVLLILPLIPFFETKVQNSISHYYYTNFRELFTGVLCAVGLFLIRYKGHKNPVFWKNDSLLTNIAGGMAFGIALFPTDPDDCLQKIYTIIPVCHPYLGTIHYVFAGMFFVVLAIVSIKVFTIGQEENVDIPVSMINENRIYKICGFLMLFFILLVPILAYTGLPYTTLICEALALFSFGTSWLIKGRALGDKGKMGEKIYRERN